FIINKTRSEINLRLFIWYINFSNIFVIPETPFYSLHHHLPDADELKKRAYALFISILHFPAAS
ncbi:MAG: hypothetical protein K2P28_10325, partial [Lachnospiraceae bacterium]|nr:hypothetical protein [Lachnospiraceae bacterium]